MTAFRARRSSSTTSTRRGFASTGGGRGAATISNGSADIVFYLLRVSNQWRREQSAGQRLCRGNSIRRSDLADQFEVRNRPENGRVYGRRTERTGGRGQAARPGSELLASE